MLKVPEFVGIFGDWAGFGGRVLGNFIYCSVWWKIFWCVSEIYDYKWLEVWYN